MSGTLTFFEKLQQSLRGTVLADESMAEHTTWKVGGPADLFLVPADADDLITALRLLSFKAVPWRVIGSGSNLLVRDGGIRGAVIDTRSLRGLESDGDCRLSAGPGLPLALLVREAVRRGLAGVEDLAGIPGTVGGAVAMNAGAGEQEIGQVLVSVTLAGVEGFEQWPVERLRPGYRHTSLPDDRIVVKALLQLHGGAEDKLAERMRQRLEQRSTAQRVTAPNAGSVFKNPPGQSAWRLIDAAGMRGARQGGAQVAEEHANFIVNRGEATAEDIEMLIDRVRDRVLETSGTLLEPEVRVLGEAAPGKRT